METEFIKINLRSDDPDLQNILEERKSHETLEGYELCAFPGKKKCGLGPAEWVEFIIVGMGVVVPIMSIVKFVHEIYKDKSKADIIIEVRNNNNSTKIKLNLNSGSTLEIES